MRHKTKIRLLLEKPYLCVIEPYKWKVGYTPIFARHLMPSRVLARGIESMNKGTETAGTLRPT